MKNGNVKVFVDPPVPHSLAFHRLNTSIIHFCRRPSILIYMKCAKCNNPLSGKQTRFCSVVCKRRFLNNWHNSSERQKKRGNDRKRELVEMKGGKCMKCTYSKCLRALSFHHRNPSTKKFGLDVRNLTNHSWESIIKEVEKCDLLCSNCHMEVEDGGPSRD